MARPSVGARGGPTKSQGSRKRPAPQGSTVRPPPPPDSGLAASFTGNGATRAGLPVQSPCDELGGLFPVHPARRNPKGPLPSLAGAREGRNPVVAGLGRQADVGTTMQECTNTPSRELCQVARCVPVTSSPGLEQKVCPPPAVPFLYRSCPAPCLARSLRCCYHSIHSLKGPLFLSLDPFWTGVLSFNVSSNCSEVLVAGSLGLLRQLPFLPCILCLWVLLLDRSRNHRLHSRLAKGPNTLLPQGLLHLDFDSLSKER